MTENEVPTSLLLELHGITWEVIRMVRLSKNGKVVKDATYRKHIKESEERREKAERVKKEKEEAETKRRASLTLKEQIKEDIEKYLLDINYGGEYEFEELEKLYREYIKSP